MIILDDVVHALLNIINTGVIQPALIDLNGLDKIIENFSSTANYILDNFRKLFFPHKQAPECVFSFVCSLASMFFCLFCN